MASLVQYGKYGAINTAGLTTLGYCVVKYVSDTFTLQEEITTNGQLSKAGELSVREEYLSCMTEKTNWYWEHN